MNNSFTANAAQFHDVDHFNEIFLGWDVECQQLGRGALNAQIAQFVSPQISAIQLSLGNALHQRAIDPSGTRSFSFLNPQCPRYHWCGLEVGPENILCSDATNGFESFSPAGFGALALTLDDAILEKTASQMGEEESIRRLSSGVALANVKTSSIKQFRANLLIRLDRVIATQDANKQDSITHRVYEDFIRLVSEASSKTSPSTLAGRAKILSKAIAYIEDNAQQGVSVAELTSQIGTTTRTLERTFREKLNTTPSAVIKKVRLDGVRQELSRYDASTISEAARRWGFWHMGDFGRDYSLEFGELPSDFVSRHKKASINTGINVMKVSTN